MHVSVHRQIPGKYYTINLPIVLDRLDNEAKGWRYAVYVLAHNALDDGRLAAVVQPPMQL